ncbi:MAG TPA: family 2 glycosyl transferase [Bacteroidales bacterium]|jgi:hypothetical protein|nr:family 2 glycosyl transferase [Bacteroidales bacterium]HBZ22555.1 family 2 glycosyl transferase [Bacteroidales bacterium]
MGFASSWLKDRALFPALIKEVPAENTEIIVVVPCYDEPEITGLLNSLAMCQEPACRVEVIIVVNAPSGAGIENLEHNAESIVRTEIWIKENPGCFFGVFVIDGTNLRSEGWGVGLARKTGMDEALRRFDYLDNPYGIILNLDADCKVKSNYFTAVYNEMHDRRDRSACSIYFEHPISGDEFSEQIYRSITQYELHLRYYLQGLAFTGFPYAQHTVGSAIAVKALPYVRAGGMNRRMAGEDFYFIQKLLPAGGFFHLNQTTVYPSPRASARVPFGTGVTIQRLTERKNETLLTYNPEAFIELKMFFSLVDNNVVYSTDDPQLAYFCLPKGIRQFVEINEWTSKIREIKSNTSGIKAFRKRFFGWFNMFKIVKYLNSVHGTLFEKRPVNESASELLEAIGKDFKSDDPVLLLLFYRSLELNG